MEMESETYALALAAVGDREEGFERLCQAIEEIDREEAVSYTHLWKPGNMLYPLPAVMVSVTDGKGEDDIITVAWTGTICTNPPMVYISVRPERYSYHMIKETGEFVINLTTEKLAKATDFCGVRSGRDRCV